MKVLLSRLLMWSAVGLLIVLPRAWQARSQVVNTETPDTILIEDFQRYAPGDAPSGWKTLSGRKLLPYKKRHKDEFFEIVAEDSSRFVRSYVNNNAHRILVRNGHDFEWDLKTHPRLGWNWRAVTLPPGAREDEVSTNDTGAAIYVTYKVNWLGRPTSVKYSYSSTLPVGTVVDYKRLKVIVVSSAVDTTGSWLSVERDVAEDYRQLFGGEPPDRPVSIVLWSDSDNTRSLTQADFDNIRLLPTAQ